MESTDATLTAALKAEAVRLGFPAVGVCPAVDAPRYDALARWIEAGRAGAMEYFARREQAYAHPRHVLDGARSLVVLGFPYRSAEPCPPVAGQGRLARYAWGQDYHDLIHERLAELAEFLRRAAPGARVRGVVDTAPLLEREFAVLAGLGWIGKNTLLLSRDLGSWFFLAVLLTDLPLDYDRPFASDHCGTCRACLEACPTDAFLGPYELDATRCISYLTIELREPIPLALRPGVGDWLFGCDICQDVCPWNHKPAAAAEPPLWPAEGRNPLDLVELFSWNEEEFRRAFRRTPLWRARRRGLLRNAAIVLGNQRTQSAVEALRLGLVDAEPLVRGAAAWALGEIGGSAAREALTARHGMETDPDVLGEIAAALARS